MRETHLGRLAAVSLILLTALVAGRAAGQPHTYIIPDIGTPGMNTYVEVISTVDSLGKFLIADGPASPTALSIQCIAASDTQRIRMSPGIVSWDGRLITFQFFVKPRAALGPVPLSILVSGRVLAIDTFWIVAPQPFGTKTGGGVIGSGGVWGTRSRRGAMIVDSMILNSGSYRFATTDTDPNRRGNQGLFPAIVISRGRIVINTGATISAAANGKDAGPGGGGGGGYGPTMPTFPFTVGEADAPQGSGFAGGRSTILSYQSPGPFGAGTGANGASINNVSAPAANGATRFFAGAPGHPMDRDGRQGGGLMLPSPMSSAYIYTLYAGGGGNVTAGSGLPAAAPAIVNGQPVGNQVLVPMFGGAGGASGASYDSTGGGGGGGVALFSCSRAIINAVDASGANGRNGVSPTGKPAGTAGDASGGGSGGCILIGATQGVQLLTATVGGGNAGSRHSLATQGSFAGAGSVGRLRHDGRLSSSIGLTAGATHYTGPTMDTLTYADSVNWTVRGTGRYRPGNGGDSILVYLRGDNTPWNFVNPYRTVVGPDSTWSVRVVFPFDSLAYVFAAQRADTTGSTEYTKVPVQVYSQAAGAVVRLDLVPRLRTQRPRVLDTVACPNVVHDTVRVFNSGTGLLILYPGTSFVGLNRGYYSIVRPTTFPDSVLPGDTGVIVIAFNASLAPNGNRSDTLRLITNDPILQIFDIPYTVIREQLDYSLAPRVIDMGGIQLGAMHDTIVVFRNRNTYQNLIFAIDPVPGASGQATYIRLSPNPTYAIPPNDSVPLRFRVIPRDTSLSTARFVVRSGPCGALDTIYFRARGITGVIDSKKSLNFPNLACGDTAIDSVWIKNVGTGPLTLHYPVIEGQDSLRYSILTPPIAGFPIVIPIGDSVLFVVRVGTGGSGSLIARLRFGNSDSLYQKNPYFVDLFADRDPAILSVGDTNVAIGSVCVGKPEEIPIGIENQSLRTNVFITRAYMGDSTGPIRVVFPNFFPYPVAASTSESIRIRVLASRPGLYRDTLYIRTEPCGRLLRMYVSFDAQEATLTATPDPIDFGDVPLTTISRRTVVLANSAPATGGMISVAGLQFRPPNPLLRIVWPILPPPRQLAPGDTMQAVIEYQPANEAALPPTELLAVLTSPCRDTLSYLVTGRGTTASIGLSRNVLTLGVGPCAPLAPVEDTLSVFNIGSASVTVSNPVILPGTFSLVSPPAGFTLRDGESKTVTVRYTPTGAGVVSGTLTYTTTDPKRPNLSVDLVGRRDTIGLEASRQRLVFPTILSCQNEIADTLVLRNTGTVPDTISRMFIEPPTNFLVGTPPPLRILVRDSLKLPLIFAPNSDGTFQVRLILAVGSCGRTDTVILEGTRHALEQSLTDLDFGSVPLGSSGSAIATVTNNNPAAIRVTGARILPASTELAIIPGQFPLNIAPGLTGQIQATYAPLIPGDLPGGIRLEVDIDTICASTLVSAVHGKAVEGGISTSRSQVNFGSLLECRQKVDTIIVKNIGIVPVAVLSASIAPATATEFSVVGGTLGPPATIAPGDSESIIVRFAPIPPPDGLRLAGLEFITDDPISPQVRVQLGGTRMSNAVVLRGPGFGVVGPGTSVQVAHWIVNTGTAPLTPASLGIAPPFRIVSTSPSLTSTIQPGDSFQVVIEFAPASVGQYDDTIRLYALDACDSLRISISASAVDLRIITAAGIWGSLTAKPGDRIRVPMTLLDDISSIPVRQLTARLSFNPGAFYPTGVSLAGSVVPNWSASSFTRGPGRTSFTIGGPDPIGGPGTIVYVEGIVTIGDSILNDLWSTDTVLTDHPRARIVLAKGTLSLEGLCDVGGNRLVQAYGSFGIKSIRPNPAHDMAEVLFEIVEDGRTTVTVHDALGRVVARPIDAVVTARRYVVAVSVGDMPAGMYYLELRTPTQVERRALLIAH